MGPLRIAEAQLLDLFPPIFHMESVLHLGHRPGL
jgi:hypothetical protein